MIRLQEIQALFFRLITNPEQMRREAAGDYFTGSRRLSPAERVQIYSDMYLWRQVEALRTDFPRLAKLLGDESFFSLCSDYLREHPSRHPDLGKLGRCLASYLATTDRQPLAELAALEWARSEVFVEADSPTVAADAVRQLNSSAFASARLQLIPAFRLLRFEYDVLAAWGQLETDGEVESPSLSGNAVAVWRNRFEVFHTELEADEAVAIERVLSMAPLAEVCEAFGRWEDPAQAAFNAIASWFAEGWVAEVRSGLDSTDR